MAGDGVKVEGDDDKMMALGKGVKHVESDSDSGWGGVLGASDDDDDDEDDESDSSSEPMQKKQKTTTYSRGTP